MDLHDVLKDATTPAHAALDSHPRLARLLRPDLSLAEYAETLAALHVAVEVCESALRAAPMAARSVSRFEERFRGNALREDIRYVESLRGAPVSVPVPEEAAAALQAALACPEAALGVLYVLEGSTLGGVFLARAVGASLGLTSDAGARFFGERGALTPVYWREFLRTLQREGNGIDHARAECVVQGARAAFTVFEAAIDAPVSNGFSALSCRTGGSPTWT